MSVISTAIPESDWEMILTAKVLPTQIATASWFKALPSDIVSFDMSAASEFIALATATDSEPQPTAPKSATKSNAAPQMSDEWENARNAMVALAVSLAGVMMLL
jgi:hypothetical protein